MDPNLSSIDRAVKAWRSAAETYTQVFESLATTTAANASEGKDEGHGHAAFKEMARTARAALDASRSFALFEDLPGPGNNANVADEDDTDGSQEDNYDAPERGRSDVRAQMADKRKQRRERKLHKRAARLALEATQRAQAQDDFAYNTVPVVEFEDVSAEVDSRLRAKDEQKAVAMKEKKRKRGSVDSMELMAVDGNVGRLGVKRAKLDNANSDGESCLGTRKTCSRDDDENAEGDFHKRRK